MYRSPLIPLVQPAQQDLEAGAGPHQPGPSAGHCPAHQAGQGHPGDGLQYDGQEYLLD